MQRRGGVSVVGGGGGGGGGVGVALPLPEQDDTMNAMSGITVSGSRRRSLRNALKRGDMTVVTPSTTHSNKGNIIISY